MNEVAELPGAGPPKPPPGLKARGKRLWGDVAGTYELRVDELVLLGRACQVVDVVAAMDKEIAKCPTLMVKGSTGQDVAHPLLAERRQHEVLLSRLFRQLGLPEDDAEVTELRRSVQARRVSRERWS